MPTTLSPYLFFAIIIMGLGSWLAVDKMLDAQAETATAKKELKDKTKTLDDERTANKLVEQSRDEYLKSLEQTRNEIESLKSNVSTGTTVLRIAAKCPVVPAVATNTSGTITASPELAEDARPAYYTHIADEDKVNDLLDMCVNQMKDDRHIKH